MVAQLRLRAVQLHLHRQAEGVAGRQKSCDSFAHCRPRPKTVAREAEGAKDDCPSTWQKCGVEVCV